MDTVVGLLTGGTGLSLADFVSLCAVSFLGSFIAASLGLGGGMLVLATMTVFLPPAVLIPLHGVVQFGSNVGRAMLMIRRAFFAVVPAFALGTLIGSAAGANMVVALPIWSLQLILAAFVLYGTWAPRFQASRPGKGRFLGVGTATGLATMFVGGTGALIAPFVAAACPERQQVVATHAVLMSLQHAIKVVAFGAIGFAFGPYLALLVGLLAFGFAGTVAGRAVLDRLPEKAFRVGLQTVLTVLALRLLYDGVTGALSGPGR